MFFLMFKLLFPQNEKSFIFLLSFYCVTNRFICSIILALAK